MKQLKDLTIKRYSTSQIIRHLDRYLDQFEEAPYRISCGSLYALSGDAYLFHCSTHDRDEVLNVLHSVYLSNF